LPPGALMQRAGAAAATLVAARLPRKAAACRDLRTRQQRRRRLRLCLELARHGAEVQCVALGAAATEDARAAFSRWAASEASR